MMNESDHEVSYKEGALVEREIDGVWFEAVVTSVVDSALFTSYSVQFTDDGKTEHDIDEMHLRPKLILEHEYMAPPRLEEEDVISSITSAMHELCADDFSWSGPSPLPAFFSADDLALQPRLAGRPATKKKIPKQTNKPRRRWSFNSSPLAPFRPPTPPMQLLPGVAWQQVRARRYEREEADFLSPLAGRCALPTCRKLTVYRCCRCNQSYSCSVACHKKVWEAGHREVCEAVPFKALFVPLVDTAAAPAPVSSVSVQNDWLADDLFFQSMPGARVPTPVDPTLTHSAAYNPWANVHGDDDLCSNLEVASIFDSRSTKCNDSAHDTSPRKASSSSSSVSTSTSCAAIYNPLVAAPRTHLPQVPEENSEEADEFTCKVNQLSEIFSRPPSEVSRVLRFFARDEDAAVEYLVQGGSKTEEEVDENINRLARIRQSSALRAVGGAVRAPPPAYHAAYSAGMTGIDEGDGTEMTGMRTSVGVGGGRSEDWSHLYAQTGTNATARAADDDDDDDDALPDLINTGDCQRLPPSPSSLDGQDGRDEVADRDANTIGEWTPGGWWASADEYRRWNSVDSEEQNMTSKDKDRGRWGRDLDPQDSRSNFFAPVGSKTLLYFIANPVQMAVERPVVCLHDQTSGIDMWRAIIFEGPVYLGKRLAKITASCVLKMGNEVLSIDAISIEIEPRDKIEALLVEENVKCSAPSAADVAAKKHGARLIDVDTPLPDLLVMLAELTPATSFPDLATPHMHELNLTLVEAMDLLVLSLEQEQEQEQGHNEVFDPFSTREWLDACFWRVVAGQALTIDTRKRSSSQQASDLAGLSGDSKWEAEVLHPHALGVALIKALLLHMHTGLLNPFSGDSNFFFHSDPSAECASEQEKQVPGRSGVRYMKYVLLGYQVQYRGVFNNQPRVIQSDKAERVFICNDEWTAGLQEQSLKQECGVGGEAGALGGSGSGSGKAGGEEKEAEWDEGVSVSEERVQELVDILMVDRDSAIEALRANYGDMNDATEWLLSKLDYS